MRYRLSKKDLVPVSDVSVSNDALDQFVYSYIGEREGPVGTNSAAQKAVRH